jgi:hypothetical protein
MGGVLKIKIQPVIVGPIADGTATRACTEWAETVTGRLGDEAVDLLRAFPMNKSGRATGAFRETLRAVRRSPTQVSVTGPQIKGVAWSSWLEGTSSRNESTKFRGYHLFRAARLALDKTAPGIGQQVLDELMPELGGG